MIKSEVLLKFFLKQKISFFTGVPDSVLKNFTEVLSGNKKISHLIGVNEGSCISIAAGYYLKSKKLGVVYMQNSGLGNAVNPLISILDKNVYSIPLIMIIGWRGAPDTKDEPQHRAQGKITKKLLNLMNIKYCEVNDQKDFHKIKSLIQFSKKNKIPSAILIKRNSIFKIKKKIKVNKNKHKISREVFLKNLLKILNFRDKIVSTTGYTSRELNHLRKKENLLKGKDFYMVGGMGHAASLSLGFSLKNKDRVLCIDGDGSLLMHMGSLLTVVNNSKKNFKYILLNNNCHESVGGQRTYSEEIDFKKFSQSVGFEKYLIIRNIQALKKNLKKYINFKKKVFIEVKIAQEVIKNLGRPEKLKDIKKEFMN